VNRVLGTAEQDSFLLCVACVLEQRIGDRQERAVAGIGTRRVRASWRVTVQVYSQFMQTNDASPACSSI